MVKFSKPILVLGNFTDARYTFFHKTKQEQSRTEIFGSVNLEFCKQQNQIHYIKK